MIERKRFGGTCVNNGCIPTKSLIASARAAHVARRAGDFGVVIEGPIRVDMKACQGAQGRDRARLQRGRRGGPAREPGRHRLRRPRPLHGPERRSRSTARRSEAEQIFINVGGRADIPPIPGIDAVPYLDQLVDDGGRLPARASGDPRRQLHRPRVRPDVPPLRQRGDGRPAQPLSDPARGRGRSRPRSARSSRARASAS